MEAEIDWSAEQAGRLLASALAAGLAAGDAVLRIYHRGFSVAYKEDRSPLTEADACAHRILQSRLAAGSGLPFLSEEGGSVPFAVRRTWPMYWLADPLDGTREFVARNGEFSINIALIVGARPALGVVYMPARGDAYFAARSLGAFHWRSVEGAAGIACGGSGRGNPLQKALAEAERLPLARPAAERAALRVLTSRHHRVAHREERFLSALRARFSRVEPVAAGSALKFCLLAEGSAEVYPRFGPTMEWDTAAGQCVLEEAGGCVTDVDAGTPLRYNQESLRNGAFLALAGRDGALAADPKFVLDAMRSA